MHHNNLNLSMRFRITFFACAAFLVILFLYFLHHYAPTHKRNTAAPDPVDTQSSGLLIRGLLEAHKEPVSEPQHLQKAESTTVLLPISQRIRVSREPRHLDSQQFQAAGQSPISVYGSDQPQITSENQSEAPRGASIATPTSSQHDFMDQASNLAKTSISDVEHPVRSSYEIKAGTIIPVILVTGINSELPGKMIAKVSQNVYDTVTGNYLLIPQGTTLLGVYDSQVAHGQERVLIAWQRLIFPNGNSIQIEGQPGVDLAGQSGLHDKVSNHYLQLYGHAALFSVLSAAGQLSQPKHADHSVTTQEAIYASIGQQMTEVNAHSISQNLAVQPTIEIRPGTHFNVLLAQDLALQGAYHFDA